MRTQQTQNKFFNYVQLFRYDKNHYIFVISDIYYFTILVNQFYYHHLKLYFNKIVNRF